MNEHPRAPQALAVHRATGESAGRRATTATGESAGRRATTATGESAGRRATTAPGGRDGPVSPAKVTSSELALTGGARSGFPQGFASRAKAKASLPVRTALRAVSRRGAALPRLTQQTVRSRASRRGLRLRRRRRRRRRRRVPSPLSRRRPRGGGTPSRPSRRVRGRRRRRRRRRGVRCRTGV
jgi:hypothetical protein